MNDQQPARYRLRNQRWFWLCVCVMVVAIGVIVWGRSKDFNSEGPVVVSPSTSLDATELPTTANEPKPSEAAFRTRPVSVLSDGFVSSSACIECHETEHQSWHASFHRTMTQLVDADTAPDAIRDTLVTVKERVYQFEQQGDQFFVTFHDPLVDRPRRRQLLMMTGSHHMHVFWYETETAGTPGELDIVFLIEEEKWIPRLSSFLRPPEPETPRLGTWNRTCSKCHATDARERFDPDSMTWDTHVAEFGIACEACHGQGADHIRRYSGPTDQRDLLREADKIVNPLTLSQHASADACGRCHSIYIPDFTVLSEEQFWEKGSPFQPGDLLAQCDFISIVQASEQHRDSEPFRRWSEMLDVTGSFWQDGMVRVAGREYNGLIESPCYQHGEMTCLSCHTMHPAKDQPLESWRDDQLKPGMRGDQACLQCHHEYADRITEHTHHPAGSSGSRCQNCHMPHTTYGLLKSIRSHQVSSPSVETSLGSDRPSACALCHLDRTFAWTAEHLHKWYGQPEVSVAPQAAAATTSTAVIHLLRGDAAQRAIAVSAFGRQEAREASGTDWMEPFLLFGLNDPYDAIRLMSARHLKSLPNRISQDVDPLASLQEQMRAFSDTVNQLDKDWRREPRPEVLIGADGKFDFLRAKNLIDQRNHRPIAINE